MQRDISEHGKYPVYQSHLLNLICCTFKIMTLNELKSIGTYHKTSQNEFVS